MAHHIKWPSIDSFHHIRKATNKYPHLCGESSVVTYRAKIKLHGTNSAVQITNEGFHAQSRTRIITPEKDNLGFAFWVYQNEEYWQKILDKHGEMVIFGEWMGPGVQKGMATNQIEWKAFAVFAIQINLPDAVDEHDNTLPKTKFIAEPEDIQDIIDERGDIAILGWYFDDLVVDWAADAEELQKCVDVANQVVAEVEKCDPFIKDVFDKDGLGEGVVYYPVSHPGRYFFSQLAFKAKGEKHQTVTQKKPVQIKPEVAEGINKFVDMVATTARLEQGATEVNNGVLEFDKKLIGPFLGWVCKDVLKECKDELVASGLEWKPVSKALATKARVWYLGKFETL